MEMNRTEKRKLEMRDHIKEVAVDLLKYKHSSDLKMEDVAKEADISRKTIYNHFSSKENLLSEIIDPMLSFCIECVKDIDVKKEVVMKDVSELCIRLHKKYGSQLNLMYNINFESLDESSALHKEYTRLFIGLFKRIEDLSYSKIEHRQVAFIVFKTFVPILNMLSQVEGYEDLFHKSFAGMVKGLE